MRHTAGARGANRSTEVFGAGEATGIGASTHANDANGMNATNLATSAAHPPRGAFAAAHDAPPSSAPSDAPRAPSQMRRVRADTLNRLLSLSGESLVESRWLKPFAESMLRVKRAQRDAARSLDSAVEALADDADPRVRGALNEARQMFTDLQRTFAARLDELDRFERRSSHIAEQLYDEALQCRMRPFGDATRAYPRVVRDLARSLGKRVRFSIVGEATQVDRDILDMLDAPLGHLLRNALDHGVEPPEVRLARGKPAEATITLEARHSAGSLLVSVSDDGPGADLAAVRAAIVRHHLTDEDTAARLSDQELLEFLLLPGFSMRERVTDVSGRGVGLDAVQEMVKSVRGAVRIFNEPGLGMRFVLQLPLTLSVIRSLIVDVGGEPYAFPLVQVRRTLELERADIDVLEGQQHFPLDDRRVGLVTAHQLLDAGELDESRPATAVVVGGEPETYGVAVDRFLGERIPPRGAFAAAHDAPPSSAPSDAPRAPSQMRRVRADTLNRLLSLSGESLVESRWLKPFAESMLRVKRAQRDAARSLDSAVEALADDADPRVRGALNEARQMFTDLQRTFAARLDELDRFERRSSHIAEQLYDEALQCRMRPFGDATRAYPRVVRDLARSLGKRVRFSIVGEATQVDRDILDMLDAPLGHLLRNALDHGVEPPEVRLARGKPAEATITLEARHSAGSLLVSVSDDGPGADLAAVRAAIVRHHLTDEDTAARLSDQELLEFLLLPGFSMRERVTDVSGRGVGLDAVQEMVKSVRGAVRIFNEPGLGMRFVLQLPLTLSVIRSLIVDVGGEPYAFPLVQVRRTLELERADIDVLEGQQHFPLDDRRVGLVTAHQLLDAGELDESRPATAVVVGGEPETYGVAVDRFLGERMLVVQPLDGRLNKIQNIAAGALLENGDPVLIVDVEDLIRSIDKLIRGGQLAKVRRGDRDALARRAKRVLVVDDSLTVRELERKLLEKRGYDVTIAIDGMDGWNAIRGDVFDLVVTYIDMPRMDGIELVTLIKGDPLLKSVPVMIVSYKDRDEDRRRGLEAGADYYLAKGGFHDEALLDAVHDLIGDA
ncbi:hybrid sensor histidine kinase/response regulator [Burkholderia pseudomallei]|uniref:hybrid sensor histidine kinase/response regulator n=1 Tax=Burkholderia pseudomallei TaxID=28450 RepID=UPI003D9BDDEC